MDILQNLLFLYLAAFPLMGSPGPATLSLAAMGSTYGATKGFNYYLGIVLGTFAVLLMIATGVTGVLLANPQFAVIITLVAAAYILYLAFKIATAPVTQTTAVSQDAPTFTGGFFLAVANPKAFTAIGAVYASIQLFPQNVVFDNIAKIAALSLVIIIVNAIWLMVGNLLSGALKNSTTARTVNIVFAVLLLLSVGAALVSLFTQLP